MCVVLVVLFFVQFVVRAARFKRHAVMSSGHLSVKRAHARQATQARRYSAPFSMPHRGSFLSGINNPKQRDGGAEKGVDVISGNAVFEADAVHCSPVGAHVECRMQATQEVWGVPMWSPRHTHDSRLVTVRALQ